MNEIPVITQPQTNLAAGGSAKKNLRVWLKMLKTTKHIEALVRERLRSEFDTTLPRFDVMSALYRFEDGLKMSELSVALRVSNGNVTGIIERLVLDGTVLRHSVAGDRRATVVRLTEQGRLEFTAMANAHEHWIDDILRVLTVSQTSSLLEIMDGIDHSHGLTDT